MSTVGIKITPADNGRRLSLADFELAEVQEGKLYELGRGVIIASDLSKPAHIRQFLAIRRQMTRFEEKHPNLIYAILGGAECKLFVVALDSERHPDLAIFKTPMPAEDDTVWRKWLPEIVIEIVSPGSEKRDYEEKREEYLALGVKEYWIFDAEREEMLVLKRSRDRWTDRTLRPGDV
jgi:Uma2 family endonuclease